MEIHDTYDHVIGKLKNFKLFPGPNHEVKKLKKKAENDLFDTPRLGLSPIIKEISSNVEHYAILPAGPICLEIPKPWFSPFPNSYSKDNYI